MKKTVIRFPASVQYVYGKLKDAGYEVYLVGGSVRDALLGIPVHDYDLTTNALPEEMRAVFASDHLIPTGEKHGTMTVRAAGENVEVTTYRTDGQYNDHRHPSGVHFTASLREDLSRRDFTINALAYDPKTGILDLFGGEEDLRKGILRAVGNAETRFEEDALRILRGLRFIARFGLECEPETAGAMRKKKELLSYLSAERVWNELQGIFKGVYGDKTVREYADILQVVLPEGELLNADFENCPEDAEVRTAKILRKETEETVAAVCRRLKMSGKSFAHIRRVHVLLNEKELSDPAKIRFLRVHYPEEDMKDVLDMRINEPGITEARYEWESLVKNGVIRSLKELDADGNDLKDAGIPAEKIGKTLEKLLELVLEEKIENKKSVLTDTALRLYQTETEVTGGHHDDAGQ